MFLRNFIFVFCFFISFNLYASVDKKLVDKAEKYLNSITGITGDFNQSSSKGKDSGTFAILRPGKIRLDYKKNPIQLISDGKDLYFVDKSLDQITTVPLSSTPAGILLRKNIKLTGSDIVVSKTEKSNNDFSLLLYMKNNEGLGKIKLVFFYSPIVFKGWTITDATGSITNVDFINTKTKTDFEKNYFNLQKVKSTNSSGDSFYD